MPTVLDATLSTFDGVRPASTGNILTQAQFNKLEDMFFHFTDDDTLGLFFFGVAANLIDLQEEDMFQEFGLFDPAGGGVNVTITGLPYLSNNSSFDLANIAPAAGPGAEGGQNASDLADIEPAAGGEDSDCWSDAVNGAAQGQTVNFSFGGEVDDALSSAASCQAGSL